MDAITPNQRTSIMDALEMLGKEINKVNRTNGWDVPEKADWNGGSNKHLIPSHIALNHSELSEALEAYRKGDWENFKEELADLVIRTLNVTDGLGINIGAEVLAKLEKNRARGFRHGNKRV